MMVIIFLIVLFMSPVFGDDFVFAPELNNTKWQIPLKNFLYLTGITELTKKERKELDKAKGTLEFEEQFLTTSIFYDSKLMWKGTLGATSYFHHNDLHFLFEGEIPSIMQISNSNNLIWYYRTNSTIIPMIFEKIE